MLGKDEILQERYRIVRQLGHGGMGAVYEAIDERFGEPIALKEITIDLTNEQQRNLVMRAFEREAKALAKVRHEAVPYVRDYFSERDRQYLVMELVDGDDLGVMLEKRGKPFPLKDSISWIEQLLDALDYLHNLKPQIIHRDIKPQNLKLNERGKIKLLDFGIARSGDKTSTVTNQTFVGATLNYSPIEQILRVIDPTFREFIILKHQAKAEKVLSQDTDVRCDIYSIGGTFYHLLTNQMPVDATKRTLEIWEGRPDPLTEPSEFNFEIPPAVSGWLLKAMEVDRENRFSSAIEMHKALQKATAEETREYITERTSRILSDPGRVNESPVSEPTLTAKTERLITADEIKPDQTLPFIAETQPALPIDSSVIPIFETQGLDNEPFVTDSSSKQVSDGGPPPAFSDSEFTGQPYFDEVRGDKKKTEPEFLPIVAPDTRGESDSRSFWILPIAALGMLAVGAIGATVWYSSSYLTKTTGPAANVVDSASTEPPTVSPKAESSIAPSSQYTPVPAQTSVASETETPKPIVSPTQNQDPVKLPSPKTPVPQAKKTPKPKVRQDPNCVFTNTCK